MISQQLIPSQPVNSALNQNQTELSVLVLPITLKMLPDGNSFLDQIVAVLGQLWSHTLSLQDTEDLVASDEADLKVCLLIMKYSLN